MRPTVTAALAALLFTLPAAADRPVLTPAEAVALAAKRQPALPAQTEWRADGRRLLVLGAGDGKVPGDLWSLDPETGRRETLLTGAALAASLAGEGGGDGGPAFALKGFALLPDGAMLLRSSAGLLRWDGGTGPLLRVLSPRDEAQSPALSPDGRAVAYARDGSLWVKPLPAGPARVAVKGEPPEILCGEPDWLYGEELDLDTAFWWSPDSARIAYLVFDERKVPGYPMPDLTGTHPEPAVQKYPRPGDTNPSVHLEVLEVATGRVSVVPGARSDGGYLPWATWSPGGKALLFARLNRDQDRLDVHRWSLGAEACEPFLQESASAWVNVFGPPRFLSDGRALWMSERDGYAHLYLLSAGGQVLRALTAGPWVVGEVLSVDEAAGAVIVSGNRDGVLGQQVYRVDLAGGGARRLGGASGWHDGAVSPGGRWMVERRSTAAAPPEVALLDLAGRRPERLLGKADAEELGRYGYVAPEFVTLKASDGTVLHAELYRPRDFDPAKRYPCVVEVYGGPYVQVVQDRWSGRWAPIVQMLLQRGFCVFSVDNRGSHRRGRDFEAAVARRLGQVEVEDQLAGLAWLKAQPFVDGERVGVWGWSYGGTMACQLLARAPQGAYAAGVAVAPVTDWMNYDSCYTERYLKGPDANASGYEMGSPARSAKTFTAPLLLLHGLADDNVHFGNSVQMADALIKAGKPFESQYYPRMDHSIHERPARTDLFARLADFFERHLKR